MKLENAKGISNDKVLQLEREIQCMAADLVGEVEHIFFVHLLNQNIFIAVECFLMCLGDDITTGSACSKFFASK